MCAAPVALRVDAPRGDLRGPAWHASRGRGRKAQSAWQRRGPEDKRSRKYWQAEYVPAGNATLMEGPGTGGQPATAPQPVSTPAAQPASAPTPTAPPALPADTPAAKAKSLHALGLTPEQIAPQLDLDPTVVAMLIAA